MIKLPQCCNMYSEFHPTSFHTLCGLAVLGKVHTTVIKLNLKIYIFMENNVFQYKQILLQDVDDSSTIFRYYLLTRF